MNRIRLAPLVAVFFLWAGLADLSAQSFFTSRVNGTNQVRFSSNTPGVLVAIDDQLAGTIPLTVYVTAGPHKFTFTAPGAEPKTLVYPIQGDVEVPFITTQRSFSLTVNTNVPGAALAVDGKAFAGNTTTASPGNHTLTVSAPGYQVLTLPFVQPSQANILTVTLIANTFPLTVNTNVPGAALAIDGAPMNGNATSVMAGNHTLTVSAPGYQVLTLPFVQPSQANILTVTLISLNGTLVVDTGRLPRVAGGYKIFVNGAEVRGNSQSLPPGTYTIRVTSGALNLETAVSVAASQTLTVSPSVQWDLH